MQSNKSSQKFIMELDSINLQDEEGFIENKKTKDYQTSKHIPLSNNIKKITKFNKKKSVWFATIDKYLNSVEYAFDKGNSTSKKVSDALDNIPEPTSKKIVIQFTFFLAILVLIIFFSSCCKSSAHAQNIVTKESEQLFTKKETLKINPRESGSTTGSIWADSLQPKPLATSYQPTHTGEIITVNIPENLQFKPDAQEANPNAQQQKFDPITSMKFEIVGIEPGGDVYLRGVKNYTSPNGEQKNIMIVAKMAQRNLNKFDVSANTLTQIAVNETGTMGPSEYSTMGWDLTVSRKIAGYAPDINTQSSALEGQRKELATQQNAFKDQQKALEEERNRLKADRARLDSETQAARKMLDSVAVVSGPDDGADSQNDKKDGKSNKNTKGKSDKK